MFVIYYLKPLTMSMKKQIWYGLMILILPAWALAQGPEKGFGKVDKEVLSMEEYERDTLAEALVLFDVGHTSFLGSDNGFSLRFHRTTRIKILKEGGLSFADLRIPYYVGDSEDERLTSFKANIYNLEDGEIQVSTIDKLKELFAEKVNENWKVRKVALPEVKVGSIIEYSFVIESPYLFNLRDWEFQWRIPVKYSNYKVEMVPFFEYVYLINGSDQTEVKSYQKPGLKQKRWGVEYDIMVHTMKMENIPAFRDESYITSYNDYVYKVDFQLARVNRPDGSKQDIIQSWPALIKEMSRDEYDRYLIAAEKYARKEYESSLSLSGKSESERFDLVVDHVKDQFVWNDIFRRSPSDRLKTITTNKSGSTADLNLLLVGMLRAAGMEAYPVLMSTRNHGQVPTDYPFLSFFNSVVVLAKVNDKYVLTDGTRKAVANNRIPTVCANGEGLMVNPDGGTNWVDLTIKKLATHTASIQYDFNLEEESCQVVMVDRYTGCSSNRIREIYLNETAEQVMEEIHPELESGEVTEIEDDIKKELIKVKSEGKLPMEVVGDFIYLKPFADNVLEKNPLQQDERTYPVNIGYKNRTRYQALLKIPEGYEVEELAELSISDDLMNVLYDASIIEDDKLNITGVVEYKKDIYMPDRYDALKNHMDKMIEVFNSPVILKKKS